MIPHVRNDSRTGLGLISNGHFNGHGLNANRNGGPVTEVMGTIEVSVF
jgi:hypothetical protein